MAPYYIVEGKMREVNKPDLPDWEIGGGPILPDRPTREDIIAYVKEKLEGIEVPPREDWPPLPPWLQPGVGLPIPPTPEFPMVPVEPPIDPPGIWPPPRPGLPDLSGKTLALVRVYVSRKVNFLAWTVIDHDELKKKYEAAKEWLKANAPAGGVGGTPPPKPTPA